LPRKPKKQIITLPGNINRIVRSGEAAIPEAVQATFLAFLVFTLVAIGWGTHRLLRNRSKWVSYGAAIAAPTIVVVMISMLGTLTFLGTPPAPPLPPAPAPPPPPPDHFDPASYIREQVAHLVPGSVVFKPPIKMRVGEGEDVTVRISRSATEAAIKQNLQGRGLPQVENIQVGNFMRVRLFGDGFKVTTHSDENQAVPEQLFAEWLFTVIPQSAGERMLDLQVAVRFKLPNSEEVTELPVLTREIAVEVNTWWTAKQFISENWKWFLSGIGGVVVADAGYFGKRWIEGPKPGGAA
jgi:hypothetical protein